MNETWLVCWSSVTSCCKPWQWVVTSVSFCSSSLTLQQNNTQQ